MHKLGWSHLSSEISQVVMTWLSSVGLALSGVRRRQVVNLSSQRWSPWWVFCRVLYDFQAPLGENQNRVVSGGVPWKADLEMGICTGEVSWGKFKRGEGGSRTGQREGLVCNTVTTEVYASPVWSAEIGIGFRVISN